MIKKILTLLLFLLSQPDLYSQIPYEAGTGSRAFALGNNHTALSSGISDLYWNPAALAFSVAREFQVSLYGMEQNSSSDFFGTSHDDDIQRFRIGNAGFSFAMPASRGGMSLAGAYSNPIILDDVFSFSGSYTLDDSTITLRERSFRETGNLDFWTLGFGMQVAKNLGIGIAASLLKGNSTAESYSDKSITVSGETYYPTEKIYTDYTAEGDYTGYDIRAGLFYKTDLFSTGGRIVFPRVVRHTDRSRGTYENEYFNSSDDYRMYSSYSGAWGASMVFPYCTITAEVRTTLPYDYLFPVEKIPDNCQAGHFKSGAGVGIEVPVIVFPIILRAGYSSDQVDLHQWMYDFIETPTSTRDFDWSDRGMKVNRRLHKITGGVGFTSATTSFDIAYGLSTWGITTNNTLEQTHYLHRVLTSLAVRF